MSYIRSGQAMGARGCRMLCWLAAVLAGALMVWVLGALPTRAGVGAAYPEEAVKAVFLYRFAGYVTWPESTAGADNFTIAILGADDVAEQLRQFLPEHPIQGRSAQVRTIQGLGELGDAQMLYIGPGVAGRLNALIEALKDRPVLIVTDQPGALEEGSTVNFLLEQQHVRFEISTVAARRSGLIIGSGLLAVAEHVKTSDMLRWSTCSPFDENNPPCPLQVVTQMTRQWLAEGG